MRSNWIITHLIQYKGLYLLIQYKGLYWSVPLKLFVFLLFLLLCLAMIRHALITNISEFVQSLHVIIGET